MLVLTVFFNVVTCDPKRHFPYRAYARAFSVEEAFESVFTVWDMWQQQVQLTTQIHTTYKLQKLINSSSIC